MYARMKTELADEKARHPIPIPHPNPHPDPNPDPNPDSNPNPDLNPSRKPDPDPSPGPNQARHKQEVARARQDATNSIALKARQQAPAAPVVAPQ